ncbi:MAG: DUF937 domain-containing protein [Oscillospiraceae bacterium]|nr:DUF937 domain-containing protein [Oscillospiraceae bacterium]
MNLLSILLKALLSDGAIKALAKKTGLSSKQLKKLLPLAVPLLIKALTKNASQTDGALSLLSALTQHTSKKSIDQQIEEADSEDGRKIIGHILGKDADADIQTLSNQSGLNASEVSSVLNGIAPALLSGLSAATGSAGAGKVDLSDGLDLGDVMAMLGGGSVQSSGGLLGGLFGKKPKEEKDAGLNGGTLLELLLANQ